MVQVLLGLKSLVLRVSLLLWVLQKSVVETDYLIQIGAFRSKGATRFAQSNMNVNNRYNAIIKEEPLKINRFTVYGSEIWQ